MAIKQHMKIKFEYQFERYEANVTVSFNVDNNYGADADGNRGEERTFIEEVRIDGIIDSQCRLVLASDNMIEEINAIASEKICEHQY